MTELELTARLTEVLCAAQARFRKQRGMGVIVTPPIPNPLIDQVAAGLAPVLRDLVDETVAAVLPALVEAAVEARLNPGGFKPAEVRTQAYWRGDGHQQVSVTHLATGLSVAKEGEYARREALLELRDLVQGAGEGR